MYQISEKQRKEIQELLAGKDTEIERLKEEVQYQKERRKAVAKDLRELQDKTNELKESLTKKSKELHTERHTMKLVLEKLDSNLKKMESFKLIEDLKTKTISTEELLDIKG